MAVGQNGTCRDTLVGVLALCVCACACMLVCVCVCIDVLLCLVDGGAVAGGWVKEQI